MDVNNKDASVKHITASVSVHTCSKNMSMPTFTQHAVHNLPTGSTVILELLDHYINVITDFDISRRRTKCVR